MTVCGQGGLVKTFLLPNSFQPEKKFSDLRSLSAAPPCHVVVSTKTESLAKAGLSWPRWQTPTLSPTDRHDRRAAACRRKILRNLAANIYPSERSRGPEDARLGPWSTDASSLYRSLTSVNAEAQRSGTPCCSSKHDSKLFRSTGTRGCASFGAALRY
jgi:hypothetical protein